MISRNEGIHPKPTRQAAIKDGISQFLGYVRHSGGSELCVGFSIRGGGDFLQGLCEAIPRGDNVLEKVHWIPLETSLHSEHDGFSGLIDLGLVQPTRLYSVCTDRVHNVVEVMRRLNGFNVVIAFPDEEAPLGSLAGVYPTDRGIWDAEDLFAISSVNSENRLVATPRAITQAQLMLAFFLGELGKKYLDVFKKQSGGDDVSPLKLIRKAQRYFVYSNDL